MPLDFHATREDMELITQIAERAHTDIPALAEMEPRSTTIMDLILAHNTFTLRLPELLKASRYEFGHDVLGIRQHLNRRTGEFEGAFLPRYAVQ